MNDMNDMNNTISSKILQEIDAGRSGENKGYSTGLDKLDSVIGGVRKATYTLITSSTGGAKTSFTLYSYVYKPLMQHIDDDNFKVLYISLEMNEVSLYLKLLSMYIWEKFHIEISYQDILSYSTPIDNDKYSIVKESLSWIDSISKKIEIFDKRANANTIYKLVKTRLEQLGEFKETDTRTLYIPVNSSLIYNIVIDHISLLAIQPTHTLKQEMDQLSSYLVYFREKCGISPVVIQQTNREQANPERAKLGRNQFTLSDTKDSGNMVQDANVVIALYNPFKDNIRNYRGYDINQLQNNFRSLAVIKNRFGESDVEIGLNFFGSISLFRELPKPQDIVDYDRYKHPLNYIGTNIDTNNIDIVSTYKTVL